MMSQKEVEEKLDKKFNMDARSTYFPPPDSDSDDEVLRPFASRESLALEWPSPMKPEQRRAFAEMALSNFSPSRSSARTSSTITDDCGASNGFFGDDDDDEAIPFVSEHERPSKLRKKQRNNRRQAARWQLLMMPL